MNNFIDLSLGESKNVNGNLVSENFDFNFLIVKCSGGLSALEIDLLFAFQIVFGVRLG